MHSIRALVVAFLLATATILALPLGHNARSLDSSNSNLDARNDIYARNPLDVTFGGQVDAAEHEAIRQQVLAHHASLPDGDPRKAAAKAHVHKGWHLTTGEEDKGLHATFRYHGAGARSSKTAIGDGVHVNKPVRRSPIEVTFGGQVDAAEHEAIRQQVLAHHASLPDSDPRKAAAKAHVHKGWHLTTGEEDKGLHATFRYHGAGARSSKTAIGDGVHVNKPARR